MKKLMAVLIVAVVFAGCSSTKNRKDTQLKSGGDVSFEYEAMTRGSYLKIIAKQDTLITINDRQMKNVATTPLKKEEWAAMLAEFESIKKNNIHIGSLESPTNRRQYDGALIAHLQIINGNKTDRSNSFDHGDPPAEIKGLVDRMLKEYIKNAARSRNDN